MMVASRYRCFAKYWSPASRYFFLRTLGSRGQPTVSKVAVRMIANRRTRKVCLSVSWPRNAALSIGQNSGQSGSHQPEGERLGRNSYGRAVIAILMEAPHGIGTATLSCPHKRVTAKRKSKLAPFIAASGGDEWGQLIFPFSGNSFVGTVK